MKKYMLLTLLIACAAIAQAQHARLDSATVSKVRGIPVFVMCEPSAAYEVVANVSDEDAASFINALGGTKTYRTIKQSCEVILDNAARKLKKGKMTAYDAVLISEDGHSGTCIKFKTE